MKPCCVYNSLEKSDQRDHFAAGLSKINRIIVIILKTLQTFGINSFRILWTCCQAVETWKALSLKAEICPMSTVASIAEDHWVVSFIRKHIKNFLNTDFPVGKTPISSPDFTMPSVVKDRFDTFKFACIKKSPNMIRGCGLG